MPTDLGAVRWSVISNTHLVNGAITLGLSDFLDPYPDVTVQVIMLGGFFVPDRFLSGLTLLGIVAHVGVIQSQKLPYRYLSMDRGQIYVGNEPQWTDTVNKVTYYLNTTLKSGDYFFAMPYDCLYYYLTGKPSPTRQLIFFDHIKIPPEQEISVIKELIAHRTGYVLMSNRISSVELGLGVFGQTYCPILAQIHPHLLCPVAASGRRLVSTARLGQ